MKEVIVLYYNPETDGIALTTKDNEYAIEFFIKKGYIFIGYV